MQQPPTSRPRHRRPESAARFRLRNAMNLVFMLMVVALMVLYFVIPDAPQQSWYIVLAIVAVVIKMSEIVIRYLPQSTH